MDNVYCIIGIYEDGEVHEDLLAVHRTEDGAKAGLDRYDANRLANNSLYERFEIRAMPVMP